MPEGLIDLTALGSQAVLVFLTQAIVGATKELVDRVTTLPTLVYAWLVASLLTIMSQIALGQPAASWVTYFTGILNGIIIAFAAGKANDIAVQPPVFRATEPGLRLGTEPGPPDGK